MCLFASLIEQRLQSADIQAGQMTDDGFVAIDPRVGEAGLVFVGTRRCHDDGAAMLEIGVEAVGLQACKLAEISSVAFAYMKW